MIKRQYGKRNESLCWYCAKCCDYRLCDIAIGQKPKCAKTKNGYVYDCENFVEDVPLPISSREFLQANNLHIHRTTLSFRVKFYTREEYIENFVENINVVLKRLKYITFAMEHDIDYSRENKRLYIQVEKLKQIYKKIVESIALYEKYKRMVRPLDYNVKKFEIVINYVNYHYNKIKNAMSIYENSLKIKFKE